MEIFKKFENLNEHFKFSKKFTILKRSDNRNFEKVKIKKKFRNLEISKSPKKVKN